MTITYSGILFLLIRIFLKIPINSKIINKLAECGFSYSFILYATQYSITYCNTFNYTPYGTLFG
jgi:hypothetical protein